MTLTVVKCGGAALALCSFVLERHVEPASTLRQVLAAAREGGRVEVGATLVVA